METTQITQLAQVGVSELLQRDNAALKPVAEAVANFLLGVKSITGRASFYNTQAEQEAAETRLHDALYSVSPGMYGVAASLPGVLDRAKQKALVRLLGTRLHIDDAKVPTILVRQLPIQRVLKTFLTVRAQRINNAKTRKLILRTLLDPERIDLWAVKYRSKMRVALEHALGKRLTNGLRNGLKDWPHTPATKLCALRALHTSDRGILQSVSFILGNPGIVEEHQDFSLVRDYELAKQDLSLGTKLPPEVLEGIRSTYHKDLPAKRVLELAKDSMTNTQRMQAQVRAKEAGVQVQWDPMTQSAVKLYIYAFERGSSKEVFQALQTKARQVFVPAGRSLLVLDTSKSMEGHKTQKYRPMAIALAMRDAFVAHSEQLAGLLVGDTSQPAKCELDSHVQGLIWPAGHTDLARALVRAASMAPDRIFILSDGYENAPAGRVSEVVLALRAMGNQVPIFHLNPVYAAESKAPRQLSDGIRVLPIADPKDLEAGMLIPLLMDAPADGLAMLYSNFCFLSAKLLRGAA